MWEPRPLEFQVNPSGCFEVVSHRPYTNGYCYVVLKGKRYRVHRFIYEEMFGPIPDGLVIRHKCDNRLCVNPEHLETGTIQDNVKDRNDRGRTAAGEQHGRSKLKESEVEKIKGLLESGFHYAVVAEAFKRNRRTVYDIANGITWKDTEARG